MKIKNTIISVKNSYIFFNVKLNVALLSVVFMLVSFVSFSQEAEATVKKSKYDNPEHGPENYMNIKQGWFLGVAVGPTLFYGDVALYNNLPKYKDIGKSAGRSINVFGGKKFKFGLAAEIELFSATLKGEKQADKLYRRRFNADMMGYSVSAKYNLSQLIFRNKNDRSFFNRLSLYLNVGGGQVFFRSRLYKYAVNNQWYLEKVSGYSSAGIDSAGVSSGGGLVTDRAKTVSAIIIPVGGKLNFKLNQKTNLVLDINYVTCFTDQMDSWSRSWSHKDRYLSAGVGLIYNFGNSKTDDIPDSDRFLRPKEKKGKASKTDDAYQASPEKTDTDKKIGSLKKRSKSTDKDLEIKLKLYEVQLKLFELQYLYNYLPI